MHRARKEGKNPRRTMPGEKWHMELVAGLGERSSQQTSKDQFSALQTIPAAFRLFSGIPV